MVTASVWADINEDGWLDLIIATEWGPIRVFENATGKLREITAAAGTSELTGWWCSLAAADVDRDGDIDLVAGNNGLNTKYKATRDKPELLYYADCQLCSSRCGRRSCQCWLRGRGDGKGVSLTTQ